MSDLLLIHAIQRNDRKAFEVLFNKYYKSLVAYITTFTKNSHLSEDIVQQAFIIIWTKRDSLKITKSPKSYLYSVVYNSYVDYYRKMKRRDVFFDDLREEALRNTIEEDNEVLEKKILKLKSIVDALPSKCKEILELNKLNGLKYREIAKKLDISQKTVEAQMGIAFKKIRKGFENDKLFFMLIRGLKNTLNNVKLYQL